LYLEVTTKKIPFYDWAKWIDEKFEKEWFDFKYRKTKRMMIVVQPKNIPEAVSINLYFLLINPTLIILIERLRSEKSRRYKDLTP
jgi:hypothetical protein